MLKRSWHDERGFSLIFVAIGLVAFVAATTLAIDVGMFMTARAQAQNSADAGALAGATALAVNSFTDRSAGGPAVQNAITAAKANIVMATEVSVQPGDVTFPLDSGGQPNLIQVVVFRTADRGNPLATLMGRFFGVETADVQATATAQVAPANAMTCVKPFMIPDKWLERTTESGAPSGPWTTTSEFNAYDTHGGSLEMPDVYVGAEDVAHYTGYTVANDVGTQLVLRGGTGDQINPGFYYSWKMPGDVGGDFYRENIENCNTSIVTWGTPIIQEPGDKVGPTIQGIEALIAKDPGAYWDSTCKCVMGSTFGTSPRVFPIPLYDPRYYADGKATGRVADFRVANFLGFFADHTSGNRVYGVITNVVGLVAPNAGPAPAGAFPMAIRLVK